MLAPSFVRPVSGVHIGTTAWFRNEAFLRTLVEQLLPIERPSILFHACSTGEEPYSFAILWYEAGGGPITIHATDIDPTFLEQAQQAKHPRLGHVERNMVDFLPATSCTAVISRTYDAVACMNALCYLPEEEQELALYRMASSAWRYLCITGGSPRAVRAGIQEANLRPLWRNWVPIYYGWRERLSWGHRKVWKLPYIPLLLPHWCYAGTSIFARDLPHSIKRQDHQPLRPVSSPASA
jgi:hypothetical protein